MPARSARNGRAARTGLDADRFAPLRRSAAAPERDPRRFLRATRGRCSARPAGERGDRRVDRFAEPLDDLPDFLRRDDERRREQHVVAELAVDRSAIG